MRREYLSLDAAAERLGWVGRGRGRRLLRVLRAKEKRRGRAILVRLGGARQGNRYRVTEALLRRYCPELFLSSPDELVVEVKRHLRSIESRVEAVVDERTAPQFEQLRANDANLASQMGRIASHTKHLDARVRRIEKTTSSRE